MSTLTSSLAIGYSNIASGATITSTTAATGYPASNLSNSRLSSSFRTAVGSLTSQNVDVDLGSAQDIDVMALIGVNLTDSATRTPRTAESSNFSTLIEYNPGSGAAFDLTYQGPVSDYSRYGRNLIVLPGQTYNSRYARLTLSNSGNPDNYLSARVYWIGPIWQPAVSFSMKDSSFKKRREIVGEPGVEKYITYLDIALDVLTEAEGRALEAICSARLRTGRLLVIPRPTQPATWQGEALYCTMAGLPTLSAWPQGGGLLYWRVGLTFKECED